MPIQRAQIEEWKEEITAIKGADTESLLLPLKHKYEDGGVCSTSGEVTVTFLLLSFNTISTQNYSRLKSLIAANNSGDLAKHNSGTCSTCWSALEKHFFSTEKQLETFNLATSSLTPNSLPKLLAYSHGPVKFQPIEELFASNNLVFLLPKTSKGCNWEPWITKGTLRRKFLQWVLLFYQRVRCNR